MYRRSLPTVGAALSQELVAEARAKVRFEGASQKQLQIGLGEQQSNRRKQTAALRIFSKSPDIYDGQRYTKLGALSKTYKLIIRRNLPPSVWPVPC